MKFPDGDRMDGVRRWTVVVGLGLGLGEVGMVGGGSSDKVHTAATKARLRVRLHRSYD